MPDEPSNDAKERTLKGQGALHPGPERVTDPVFAADPFFDARDLVQVKYEMLRRVRVEALPVSRAAAAFGFSRPTFYEAQSAFERHGLSGLVPKKRGPRGGHKLTEEVLRFLAELVQKEGLLSSQALAERVQERFGVSVHPRSVERALQRKKKPR